MSPVERFTDLCVILLDGIGDVVHGLPVVNALKDHNPELRIAWVAEPAPAAVLAAHPSVDDVIVYDRDAGLSGIAELRRAFRGRRFDIALNLHLYFKSVFPTVLSGAPIRLGMDRTKVHDQIWLFCNRHIEPAPLAHTQDMFLRFLDSLGVPRPDPLEWRITLTTAERREQAAFFSALPDRPVIGLALASKNDGKDWPADRYAELAPRLAERFDATVILVGGPDEREKSAAQTVIERGGDRVVTALADDVRRLIWLIERCDLLISPDTGPLHIAHALDVPVVGLYGHTNPARYGPYERFRDLVIDHYHEPGEKPDPSRRDARGRRMERITVEEILERSQAGFDRYVLPRRSSRARSEARPHETT